MYGGNRPPVAPRLPRPSQHYRSFSALDYHGWRSSPPGRARHDHALCSRTQAGASAPLLPFLSTYLQFSSIKSVFLSAAHARLSARAGGTVLHWRVDPPLRRRDGKRLRKQGQPVDSDTGVVYSNAPRRLESPQLPKCHRKRANLSSTSLRTTRSTRTPSSLMQFAFTSPYVYTA